MNEVSCKVFNRKKFLYYNTKNNFSDVIFLEKIEDKHIDFGQLINHSAHLEDIAIPKFCVVSATISCFFNRIKLKTLLLWIRR